MYYFSRILFIFCLIVGVCMTASLLVAFCWDNLLITITLLVCSAAFFFSAQTFRQTAALPPKPRQKTL